MSFTTSGPHRGNYGVSTGGSLPGLRPADLRGQCIYATAISLRGLAKMLSTIAWPPTNLPGPLKIACTEQYALKNVDHDNA